MTNLNKTQTEVADTLQAAQIVRYSNVWEDYNHSFYVVDNYDIKNILMIGSGGENVFNLLAKKNVNITAVDANSKQIELIKIKMQAIKVLTREQYISFLGLSESFNRCELISLLNVPKSKLLDDIEVYGALFVGKLEQYFKTWSSFLSENYKDFEKLFNEDTKGLEKLINGDGFKKCFFQYFNEESLGKGGRDESMYNNVEINSAEFFWEKYVNAITNFSNGKSMYFDLFNFSNIQKSMLPFYLQNDINYNKLKTNLNNLELKVGLIDQVLVSSKQSNKFDFAILSNIFEYLSIVQAKELLASLEKHMKENSVLLYWNLLKPINASELNDKWLFQEKISQKMSEQDLSWYYQNVRLELKGDMS